MARETGSSSTHQNGGASPGAPGGEIGPRSTSGGWDHGGAGNGEGLPASFNAKRMLPPGASSSGSGGASDSPCSSRPSRPVRNSAPAGSAALPSPVQSANSGAARFQARP